MFLFSSFLHKTFLSGEVGFYTLTFFFEHKMTTLLLFILKNLVEIFILTKETKHFDIIYTLTQDHCFNNQKILSCKFKNLWGTAKACYKKIGSTRRQISIYTTQNSKTILFAKAFFFPVSSFFFLNKFPLKLLFFFSAKVTAGVQIFFVFQKNEALVYVLACDTQRVLLGKQRERVFSRKKSLSCVVPFFIPGKLCTWWGRKEKKQKKKERAAEEKSFEKKERTGETFKQ